GAPPTRWRRPRLQLPAARTRLRPSSSRGVQRTLFLESPAGSRASPPYRFAVVRLLLPKAHDRRTRRQDSPRGAIARSSWRLDTCDTIDRSTSQGEHHAHPGIERGSRGGELVPHETATTKFHGAPESGQHTNRFTRAADG